MIDRNVLKKSALKNLELYSEKKGGTVSYYLKAVYEYYDKYKKLEITVPRLSLPIYDGDNVILKSTCDLIPEHTLDIGFGDLPLIPDEYNQIYYKKVIEKYPQKMTLSEIEKKLGYKVEIVSEKPDAK